MSTKNLARTVIEGGRSNKFARRRSNKLLRRQESRFLSETRRLEDADDSGVYPDRDDSAERYAKRRYGLTDKLSPLRHYLNKQVGKQWAEVYSELVNKFDSRTVAGRHVLNDHIIREIHGAGSQESSDAAIYRRFYLDNGILRKTQQPKREKVDYGRFLSRESDYQEMADWLKGRKLLLVGPKKVLYWAVANKPVNTFVQKNVRNDYWKASVTCELIWFVVDKNGEKVMENVPYCGYNAGGALRYCQRPISPVTWRQDEPASLKDVEYYNSWCESVRERITYKPWG